MGGIAQAYAAGTPALDPFFGARPTDALAAPAFGSDWGAGITEAMRAYQDELGQPKAPPQGYAVVTGQQPAIFCGPLYTVYKAITALQLADRFRRETGESCTPIFWNAAEDHDFEEARTATLLTKSGQPLRLDYTPQAHRPGLPMERVPVEAQLYAFVNEAAARCAGSEHRDAVHAALRETLDEAVSLADWSVRCLARLFSDTPLQFFTPTLPAARQVAATVLAREIDAPLESTRRVNAAGERLAALGYGAQVQKAPDECSFFLTLEGRRCKVRFAEGAFHLPEVRQRLSVSEMRSLLDAAPERFSPNVVLRCVVQQHLFPTVAYVAGPGETAYWAQLREVFAFFDTPMPVVYPRAQALLMTTKWRTLREKLGLNEADLTQHAEQLVEPVLRAMPEPPGLVAFRARRAQAADALEALFRDVRAADAHAGPAVDAGERRTRDTLARLERRLLYADKAKRRAVHERIARLQAALAPNRQPQERVYSIFSFLFAHGFELIPRLIEAIDARRFDVQEITL